MAGAIRLLKTAEAAAYLGREPATLRWWRSKGRGPRWSGEYSGVRYRLADLDAWIEANTHSATPTGKARSMPTDQIVRCRYLRQNEQRCTAEVVDPAADILLCTKHLARAMALITGARAARKKIRA